MQCSSLSFVTFLLPSFLLPSFPLSPSPAFHLVAMSVDHYENFPVASILLPARLRPAVQAIYAFARSADDLADEGDAAPAQRLEALEHYRTSLDRIARNQATGSALFDRLAQVVAGHRLSLEPFYDLLSAFRQDVVTTRYDTALELLDYCRRSADPVGRLMLRLYETDGPDNLAASDAICSALQLINFAQDVQIDWDKGRIYLPQEDLARFGVDESWLEEKRADAAWRALMNHQLQRARALMLSGAPLVHHVPGRIGWELRLIVQGGLRIIERIEAVDHDVFRRRPQLQSADWGRMLWRAARMRPASVPLQDAPSA